MPNRRALGRILRGTAQYLKVGLIAVGTSACPYTTCYYQTRPVPRWSPREERLLFERLEREFGNEV